MSCWGDWATRKWKKRLSCADKWRPGGPARTHPRLRGAPPAGAAGDAGAGNDETSKALAWVCGLKNASSAMVSRVRVGLPEWCLEGVVQRYKAAAAERESASTVVEIMRGKPPPRTPTVSQLTREDAQQGRSSFWGVFAACWCGSRQGVAARALSALPRRRTWSPAQQW